MEYIFLIVAISLYVPMILSDKLGSTVTQEKELLVRYSLFRSAVGVGIGAILFIVRGNITFPDLPTVLTAFLFGITLALGLLVTFYSMQVTSIAIASVFKAASVMIPCISGALFFEEPITVINSIGFVLFLISIFFVVSGKQTEKKKFGIHTALVCLCVIFVNGFGSLAIQLFGRCVQNGNKDLFMFLSYGIEMIILFFMSCACKKRKNPGTEISISRKMKFYGIIGTVSAFSIQQITTALSSKLPSALIFPSTMGSSVVFGILIGRIFYRERLSLLNILGIVGVAASLIMINLF